MTIRLSKYPFISLLICYIAGAYPALSLPPSPGVFGCVVTLCFLLLATVVLYKLVYRKKFLYLYSSLPGGLLLIVITCLAYINTSLQVPANAKDHFSKHKSAALLVQVDAEPKRTANVTQAEVRVIRGFNSSNGHALCGRLKLSIENQPYKPLCIAMGSRMLIPSNYKTLPEPLNPYEFNYKAYMANRGTYHQQYIKAEDIKLLKADARFNLKYKAIHLRETMIKKLEAGIRNREVSALLSTLLLGYKASLSADVQAIYSRTGTVHVLSVSGMHVSIIMALLTFMLGFLSKSSLLVLLRSLLVLAAIWFYAFISGLSAPVCRAATMISFFILAQATGRDQNSLNTLAASAFILLSIKPSYLKDVGFQLSYLAVFGLIAFYPLIKGAVQSKYRLINFLWSYVSVSMAAQLATVPLAMYYFNQFPVYFILSNLLVLLPVTLLMYGGVLFLLLPECAVSYKLAMLLEQTVIYLNGALSYIARLPYGSLHSFRFPLAYYLAVYLCIWMSFLTVKYRQKAYVYIMALTITGVVCYNSFNTIKLGRQRKLIVYNVKKRICIGAFDGAKVWLLTDMKQEGSAFTYSVKPSLEAEQSLLYRYTAISDTINQAPIYYKAPFYRFYKYRLMVLDDTFQEFESKRKIQVDALYYNSDHFLSISKLLQSVGFKTLIIGNAVPLASAMHLTKEAETAGLSVYSLKNNPAFVKKFNSDDLL